MCGQWQDWAIIYYFPEWFVVADRQKHFWNMIAGLSQHGLRRMTKTGQSSCRHHTPHTACHLNRANPSGKYTTSMQTHVTNKSAHTALPATPMPWQGQTNPVWQLCAKQWRKTAETNVWAVMLTHLDTHWHCKERQTYETGSKENRMQQRLCLFGLIKVTEKIYSFVIQWVTFVMSLPAQQFLP